MAGEAAAQFHLLDLAGSRLESARRTQTPQYLVIVLSDGWSFGGRDLGSDAGGYKQRVVVAGCYTKGAGLVGTARTLDVALHTQDPTGRIFDQMELRPAASCEFPRGGHFRVQTGSLGPSVTRVIDEQSKGFGPLDSSFAPVAKKCRLNRI